jgi:PKD repeat protein
VLAGTYSVSVKATNPGGSTTKAFKIIVKPGKNGTIGNQTNDTNDVVNITTAANFTTAPGATYSATGLPSGLSIDAGGVITGTPDTIGGPSNVVVTATDVNGTASQSFTWTVTAP